MNTAWTMKACQPSHRGQAVRNTAILCDSVLAPQEPPPSLHKVIVAPVRPSDPVHSRSFRPVPKSPGTTAGLQSDRLPVEIQHESRGPRQRRPRGTGRAGSQDEARDALGGRGAARERGGAPDAHLTLRLPPCWAEAFREAGVSTSSAGPALTLASESQRWTLGRQSSPQIPVLLTFSLGATLTHRGAFLRGQRNPPPPPRLGLDPDSPPPRFANPRADCVSVLSSKRRRARPPRTPHHLFFGFWGDFPLLPQNERRDMRSPKRANLKPAPPEFRLLGGEMS
ncbi:uncharacterized protein LOC133775789 [Lepus europaeus]|uniref:uncharacterized protein LOC133775789 n=1 Tax=Lepus europaeus TaxID=9983 RepID=UPI002B4728B8|nr:uncharacterized protein LOC133775789 [Lepus europaeus]